jgi:hypothetical protein
MRWKLGKFSQAIIVFVCGAFCGALLMPAAGGWLYAIQGDRDLKCHLDICIGDSENLAIRRLTAYPPLQGGLQAVTCGPEATGVVLLFPYFLSRKCTEDEHGFIFSNGISNTLILFRGHLVVRIIDQPLRAFYI